MRISTSKTLPKVNPGVTSPAKTPELPGEAPSLISKDDVFAVGSGVAGGALLGVGGLYLGTAVGIDMGFRALGLGAGPPLAEVGKIVVAIPMALSYGLTGAAIGGIAGTATGAIAGLALYSHFSSSE